MIQMQTILDVADNSGAKSVMCVKVLGGSKRFFAHACDLIVVSIRTALPKSKVNKGDVYTGVIVRTKTGIRRKDGSILKFNQNAVVLLNKNYEPIGTRVVGPVPRELRNEAASKQKNEGFLKIVSLAQEVL